MAARIHVFTLLIVLASAAYAIGPCEDLQWRYTDASGRKFCGAHHIPLITVRGFAMPDRSTIYDPIDEADGDFERCNPNCISDYFSLRRTKMFSQPFDITYCKKCEAAIHAWRLTHYPGYRASDTGGTFLERL